jgi:hypothetical protein
MDKNKILNFIKNIKETYKLLQVLVWLQACDSHPPRLLQEKRENIYSPCPRAKAQANWREKCVGAVCPL